MSTEDDEVHKREVEQLKADTKRIMSMLDPEGEREYDLHNRSFEETVDFFGMLAAVTVPSHIKPRFDPVEMIKFYTDLFHKPEILHAKYSGDIDRIFLLIGNGFDYGLPTLMENPAIPLQLR